MGSPSSSPITSAVIPKPPAAFSTLTMQKSTWWRSTSPGSSLRSTRRPGLPTMSPTKRSFTPARRSLRVLDRTGLADHRDLDLARVGEVLLDLLGDVAREPDRLLVGDLLAVHDDADLAAGLDREALLHALEARGDLLELLEPLDVGLEHLAARAGSCRGEPVGRRHQHRLHRLRVVVAVVAGHRV